MEDNLKKKTLSGLIWQYAEKCGAQVVNFVVSVILARLLTPADYGLIGLITVFISIALVFARSGMGQALVQKKDANDEDFSTVFYFSLAVSVVLYFVLFFTAPIISGFYHEPKLIPVIRVLGITIIIGAVYSVQQARVQRDMNFNKFFFATLIGTLISAGIGIAMAYMGLGIWALVVYFFAQVAMSSIAMLFVLRWFPHCRFSMDSAKRLYGFGIKMLAASIITTLYNDIRPLIIGKKFSTASLGYYERGQRFSSTISLNLDAAVQSVMFPVLARAQDDKAQFSAILSRTRQLGAFIIFPTMFGMAAVAEPMVRVLLTEEWLPGVIFVQLLCLAEAQVPITTSNLLAVKSLGRSDVYAKQEVLRRVLMLIVLAVSVLCFDSVEAIAVGFLVSAWIDAFVTVIPVIRLLDSSLRQQFTGLFKMILAAGIMGLAVFSLNLLALAPFAKLMLQICCGLILYPALCIVLKVESMRYVLSMLNKRKGDKTNAS